MSGFLQVMACAEGGLAVRTANCLIAPAGESALFRPLPASSNTATGDLLIGLGGKIQ